MGRVRLAAVAAALALVLGAGAGCDEPVQLGDDDSGTAITLGTGETFEIVLSSNPTTGYSWSAADVPACLEQEGESEYTSDAPAGMMGAGGAETWRFTAVEPGEGTLVLQYTRPWESDQEAPVEVYDVDVTVE